MSEYFLEMNHISKGFPGVQALSDVTLKVKKGTVHALLGENGAGKSTLMKILTGIYEADEGEILIGGQKKHFKSIKESDDSGVAIIHQELNNVLDLSVAENVFLGREPVRKKLVPHIDHKRINAETKILLDKYNLSYRVDEKMRDLSVADMQMIEIVKAVSGNASLIVMDEPTSSIEESEVQLLFKQIRELKKEGKTIIYISHRMEEIFEIADELTVLRDGKYIGTKSVSEVTANEIIHMMVGRELTDMFPKTECEIGDVILEVKDLCAHGCFEDVSFTVRRGEILGFSGLIGAGRTEVMECLFGLRRIDAGRIFIGGREISIKNTTDAMKNGIALANEDRKRFGLIMIRSILENCSLANLEQYVRFLKINQKEERKNVLDVVEELNVKAPSVETPAGSLSGGNQQKVVLAKWLLRKPQIMLLDEPTRGIDVGAKAEIHKLMCKLAGQGMAVVLISSELPEILGMSDRIIVMHEGRIKGELSRGEASQDKIMELAVGGQK